MNSTIMGIAELTFRRMREPAFMILILFAAAMGSCVSEMESFLFQEDFLMGCVSVSNVEKPVIGSFFLITCLSVLVGILSSSSEIPREIDNRLILILLGKPVTRAEYIIGKYVGLLSITLCFFAVAGLATYVSHLTKTGEMHSFPLIVRQFVLMFALFPFVAMTLAISCFLSEISAMIMSVVYVFFCLFFCTLPLLLEMLPQSMGIKSPLMGFYYFFPNFYFFLMPMRVTGIVVLFLALYSASITAIFLLIAILKFNTKDIL